MDDIQPLHESGPVTIEPIMLLSGGVSYAVKCSEHNGFFQRRQAFIIAQTTGALHLEQCHGYSWYDAMEGWRQPNGPTAGPVAEGV